MSACLVAAQLQVPTRLIVPYSDHDARTILPQSMSHVHATELTRSSLQVRTGAGVPHLQHLHFRALSLGGELQKLTLLLLQNTLVARALPLVLRCHPRHVSKPRQRAASSCRPVIGSPSRDTERQTFRILRRARCLCSFQQPLWLEPDAQSHPNGCCGRVRKLNFHFACMRSPDVP